jgi:hypothetical protein
MNNNMINNMINVFKKFKINYFKLMNNIKLIMIYFIKYVLKNYIIYY